MSVQATKSVHTYPTLPPKDHKEKILWYMVVFFVYLHLGAFYGLYAAFAHAKWQTILWFVFICEISTQGTGAGVHRLWAHKTYKAKLPLRILLCILQTLTLQKDIYNWVRDHRGHHKYSDTIYDPHNANRGFFYSHMGWLMCKKSEAVVSKGKQLDMSDLEEDSVVVFQRKYYWALSPIIALAVPSMVPWYYWGENFCVSWYVCNMLRYCLTLHGTCLVNSAAHMFGNKPYDSTILPSQNMMVSYITNGEGFHNYHHAFPWDYKAAELGSYSGNWSTAFIEFFAKVGWAYDLKTVSLSMIEKRVKRVGDGTRPVTAMAWEWEDGDIIKGEKKMATIRRPLRSG